MQLFQLALPWEFLQRVCALSNSVDSRKREFAMPRNAPPETMLITSKKVALTVFCCTVLMLLAANAQTPQSIKADPANNNPPPVGAILDLSGTPIPGGGNNTYQQYTVNFQATVTNTAITFAFREDPAFISFSNVSVVDLTTPGPNLITNGDFSGGTYTSSGNSLTPIGWIYANIFGAAAGGFVSSNCGVGPSPGFQYGVGNCIFDGAIQAYDAFSQTITTVIGHTYQISFWVADNSGCSTDIAFELPCNFSDISTNGNTTGTGGNGINVAVYAQEGLPATQTAPPQPIVGGQPNQFQFDNTQGQIVTHTVTWPANLTFQNGVTSPEVVSTNMIVSNTDGIQRFTSHTPWATGLLLEHQGDDVQQNGTGFGSLYRDACFQQGNDPSTATLSNCPVGTNPSDLVLLNDTFDFPPNGKVDIALGTTVSLLHHPGTRVTDLSPTVDWAPIPTTATSNPVCDQVQINVSGSPYLCDLEDILLPDPAAPTRGGVFGDQTGITGGARGRGVVGSLYRIPMPTTTDFVNNTQVNNPGVQGSMVHWFNTGTLQLKFVSNPACTAVNPPPQACTVPTNGYFAAPVRNLAYVFYNSNSPEPPLPDPANCDSPAPAGSTCVLSSGTLGMFTNPVPGTNCQGPGNPAGCVAAPVDFTDSVSPGQDGIFILAQSTKDTVNITERLVQLLTDPSAVCPNPFGLNPAPTPPCYSTTLFSEELGIDTHGPNVSVPTLSPAPVNGTYAPGTSVTASVSCVDPIFNGTASGVTKCGNNTYTPSPTPPAAAQSAENGSISTTISSTPGSQKITVTAQDQAGNVGSNSVSVCSGYTITSVDRNGVVGFTTPVDNPPAVNLVGSSQVIPLSLTVRDCNGNFVSNLDLVGSTKVGTVKTVVLSATNAPSRTCASVKTNNGITTSAAGSSGWQIMSNGVYDYNWQPRAPVGSCLAFSINLGDNIQHTAYFSVVKK